MHQDKLGCYFVGEAKFYSKLEAIEAMKKTGIHLHWDFNESIFGSLNWKQEPPEALSELYRRRAQQLRDQYDYIVLFYSGGPDSDNALHSFIDNDIRIDEVVSKINIEATGDRNSWMNEEIYKTAIPKISLMRQKQSFRHRLIDLTPMQIDYFNDVENRYDWIYQMTMAWTPNCVSRENFAMKIPEWKKIIDQGKKFCILWGCDKPRLAQVDGKFCVRFLDCFDTAATSRSMAGLQSYTDELFYWTPDLPEIVIKQAHILKNYLQGDIIQKQYITLEKSDLAFKEYQGRIYWLSKDGVHSLIYPNWRPGLVVCGKPTSIIFSDRDTWFFNLQSEHPIKKVWQMGIDKLWKTIPDYWKNNAADIKKGIKLCVSPEYFIE